MTRLSLMVLCTLSARAGDDPNFAAGFQSTFVRSCVSSWGATDEPAAAAICGCVAVDLLDRMTDEELLTWSTKVGAQGMSDDDRALLGKSLTACTTDRDMADEVLRVARSGCEAGLPDNPAGVELCTCATARTLQDKRYADDIFNRTTSARKAVELHAEACRKGKQPRQ